MITLISIGALMYLYSVYFFIKNYQELKENTRLIKPSFSDVLMKLQDESMGVLFILVLGTVWIIVICLYLIYLFLP